MPLSCNTVFINRDIDLSYDEVKTYKGRFYFSAIADNQNERSCVIEKTKEILKSLAFNIYN